jgi:hypothetical protein
LPGHSHYIYSLTFDPEGTTLASGSGDFTIRLWDTAPVARRLKMRREAAALQPEAERLVAQLFTELKDPEQVITRLRADPGLNDRSRPRLARGPAPRFEQESEPWMTGQGEER